jgi:hypothetical protein
MNLRFPNYITVIKPDKDFLFENMVVIPYTGLEPSNLLKSHAKKHHKCCTVPCPFNAGWFSTQKKLKLPHYTREGA